MSHLVTHPVSSAMKREADPNGLGQHQPGAKLDAGKPRLSLVLGDFGQALTEVSKVGTFGATKYTEHGWLSVANGQERYTDALMRHLFTELQGEKVDPDSQLLHAAHLAWNALARLELMIRNQKHSSNTIPGSTLTSVFGPCEITGILRNESNVSGLLG